MGAYEMMPDFYEYIKNPNAETNDWDWTIDPSGMEYLLRDIYQRYNIPIIITENGLGAVSYTHLDVYKRQVYNFSINNTATCVSS